MTLPFTVHRVVKSGEAALPLHAHDEAQLVFAASGLVQVHTQVGVWLVPPQITAWIPPGMPHRLDIITQAELWMVHWQGVALSTWLPEDFPTGAFASRVTPLLRSLLASLVEMEASPDKAELVARLIPHELTAMADAPTFLPMPTSATGLRLAELAVADQKNRLDLGELASRAATSVRSASRLFPAETGMTLKTWRQRARIASTMRALAAGTPVARVASDAGFSSTAAFCFSFKQVTAMTPGEFLEGD